MSRPQTALFASRIVVPALGSALGKLDPRQMIRNPVMFVVEVVALLTTVLFHRAPARAAGRSPPAARRTDSADSGFDDGDR